VNTKPLSCAIFSTRLGELPADPGPAPPMPFQLVGEAQLALAAIA
jgi:hypothetical protein